MARSGNYEFVSDFSKKRRSEGEARGEVKGRAESLIQVLALRGCAIDEPLRRRITQASIEQLEAWLAKAVTASAITDVFQDG